MTFDPADWHAVGVACAAGLEGAPEEASRRTAIGRAYYAALLSIKRRVEAVQGEGVVPEARIHSAVPRALKDSGLREFRRVIDLLRDLKEDREDADYEIDVEPFKADEVEEALKRSRRLLDLLTAIPAERYRNLTFGG